MKTTTTIYFAYDDYDGNEFLGKCQTLKEASALCRQRIKETDGECDVMVIKKTVINLKGQNEIHLHIMLPRA
jgi:hypothetical protein